MSRMESASRSPASLRASSLPAAAAAAGFSAVSRLTDDSSPLSFLPPPCAVVSSPLLLSRIHDCSVRSTTARPVRPGGTRPAPPYPATAGRGIPGEPPACGGGDEGWGRIGTPRSSSAGAGSDPPLPAAVSHRPALGSGCASRPTCCRCSPDQLVSSSSGRSALDLDSKPSRQRVTAAAAARRSAGDFAGSLSADSLDDSVECGRGRVTAGLNVAA